MKHKFGLAGLCLASALAFGSGAAVAAVVDENDCDLYNVRTNPGADAIACEGSFNQQGQPSGAQVIAALDTMRNLDWSFAGKVDGSDGTSGQLTITGISKTSGTWKIKNPVAGSIYALILKGANEWAVYLLSTPGFTGTWNVAGVLETRGDRNTPGLSNAQLYVAPAPVPLPAAGWLMVAGLGALAASRRRSA